MVNITTATANHPQSPFDSIRRFDEHGNEHWMARELMKLLGYKTWQKFCDAIDRARSTCLLNRELEANHINHLPGSVSASGRTGDDYRLSRNACYWIAMSGDTRKPEIALAHQYFAVRTREAETRAVPSEQLQLAQLENENIKLKMLVMDLHGVELGLTILGKEDRIVEVEKVSTEIVQPATGRSDKILTSDQLKSEVARKTGQKLKTMKQFTDRLKAKGRDDLLVPVTRHSTNEYVNPDKLNEAIAVVFGEERQAVLKPAGQLARK